MKLIQLTARNVLRLRAVRLDFDPAQRVFVIGGKNGAGKTSVLSAIEMTLGGMDHVPGEPLRRGTDGGESAVILGQNGQPRLKVRRLYGPDRSSSLVVESVDGFRPRSPQALLDEFFSSLTFDPLAFSRMRPGEQSEALRQLVGLDLTELDAARAAAREERLVAGRALRTLEGAIAAAPEPPPGPLELEDPAAALEQLDKIEAERKAAAALDTKARVAAEAAHGALQREGLTASRLRAIEAQLLEARKDVERAQALTSEATERAREAEAAASAAAAALPSDEPLRAALRDLEQRNAETRARQQYAARAAELRAARSSWQACEEQVKTLDLERQSRIEAAAMPLPGLGLADEGVVLNGLPFSQASASEQLRVSMAMGGAMNPRLRLVLIRDGSLLDEDSLAEVARIAREMDLQVLLERVGVDSHTSVVIEDGSVVTQE